ncbi:unnamed protein product [Diamesa tonsa]
MKVDKVILVVLSVVSACYGKRVFSDTKAEGCVDGVCGFVCSYDGVQMFPGHIAEIHGKCWVYVCTDEFEVYVQGCDYIDNSHLWRDVSKPYPACC